MNISKCSEPHIEIMDRENRQTTTMSRMKQSVDTMKKHMEVTKEEEKYRDENNHLQDCMKNYKCTKCGASFISKINKGSSISVHPLLDVLMCPPCCNYYGDGNFSLDSEGEDKYCRWCGEGGTLFSCSKCICAFCKKCVKKHFDDEELKKIESDDDWICFFCDSKPLWYLRLICTFAKEASKRKKAELELKPKDKFQRTRKRGSTRNVAEKESNSSDSIKNSSSDSGVSRKKRRKCKSGSSHKTCSVSSSETEKENRLNRNRKAQQKKGRASQRSVTVFRTSKNFISHAESSDEDEDKDGDEDENKIEDKDKDKDNDEDKNRVEDDDLGNKQNQCYITDKLKGIWKITQIISEIGLKWSRERLEILSNSNAGKTLINLEKEYRKIKSVTSMLSSSINKACDSVESLRDDLNSDNVKDERHVFRCEEANIVRLAKKLVDDSDLEDSMMHGKPNSTKMRKKSEGSEKSRDKSGGKSGKENGKIVRNEDWKSDQSQSLFSGADTESDGDESKKVTDVKSDRVTKPLLKVKDFAKMNSENIFENAEHVFFNDNEEKKEENVYEVETECSSDEETVEKQEKKEREPLNSESDDEKIYGGKGTTRTRKKKNEMDDKFGRFKERRRQYLLNASQNEYDKKNAEDKGKMTLLESNSESRDSEGKNDSDEWVTKRQKNQYRRKILTSDEEEEKEDKSSDSSSVPEYMKNQRRPRKRETKKAESSSEDEENDPKSQRRNKKNEGRKNIKKILKKDSLKLSTKEALKTEEERRKRVEERNKLLEKIRKESQTEPSGNSSTDGDRSSYTSGTEDDKTKRSGSVGKEEEINDDKADITKKINENGKGNCQSLGERNGDRSNTLILDFDVDTKKPLVTVHKKLVKKLKPHQMEGVKFMWDNCFESVKRLEGDSGSGCILAHYMGLGKTLQVVTLVHTVMNHNLGVHSVLIICPLSTLSNWVGEFEMWLADIDTEPIILYDLLSYKKNEERLDQVREWQRTGGILFLSYELFRTLVKPGKKKTKTMQRIFEECLCDPGPDLVVCDEGHLLKNEDTALSKCVNQIKTARRIVLTGTPLQNNLMEYHCMVQFVKPNILGTKKEFSNRFVNPITNGQFEDSTEEDVRIMKRRSHVLHSMLNGCVQRCDYSVLTPYLPMKYEYVLSIALTGAQIKAHRYFIENLSTKMVGSSRTTTLFNDYHNLQRLWTHPWVLRMHKEKDNQKGFDNAELKGSMKNYIIYSDEDTPSSPIGSDASVEEMSEKRGGSETSDRVEATNSGAKDWWTDYFKETDYEDIRSGNKLKLLFFLLKACGEIGDKVLVFSQSLYSLDLIEHFLSKVDEVTSSEQEDEPLMSEFKDSWVSGVDYFRLDGQTSVDLRSSWCTSFNKESNKRARLFLISTRAGGLGINLFAANRVVMFDASWNPSHDLQSIFRVYRFGQKKTCYIYRFLAEATMEEKIYERQVTKLSLAHRVVDEHQIERHYSMMNLHELYTFKPTPSEKRKTPKLPKDKILAKMLVAYKEEIVSYHEHDSLLANKEEEELTEEERKAAWQEFEEEQAQKNVGTPFDLLEFQRQLTSGMINPHAGAHLQNGMFPMLPSEIPAHVLERGLLLGLVPRYSETLESFINRIQNRQLFIGSNDRET